MTRTKMTSVAALAVVVVMAVAVVAIGQGASAPYPSLQHTLEASATVNGTGTLAEQRADALASGTIPDDYLISKTGDAWRKHMGDDEIEKFERVYINMLVTGEDTHHKDLTTRLSLTGQNFHTLTEKPDTHMDEVAVAVLHKSILNGTYTVPDSEPVRLYHEYILDLYENDLPDTIGGTEDHLVELTGEMAPMAHVILDTHNRWAKAGMVPFEQFGSDPDYWWGVADLHMCKYNSKHSGSGDDCSAERDHLENERWLEEDPEFIPPPGQDWPPPYLNFILPLAHAYSYIFMDYELKYITGGWGGL